jgi:hypothetical protein
MNRARTERVWVRRCTRLSACQFAAGDQSLSSMSMWAAAVSVSAVPAARMLPISTRTFASSWKARM